MVEGGVFLAWLELPPDASPVEAQGVFQDRAVQFFPEANGRRYGAVIGVEYGTPAGSARVTAWFRAADGARFEARASIEVKTGSFPAEKLRVPPRTIKPSKSDLKQIGRDRALLGRAYATRTSVKYWDPPAVMPVSLGVTSVYGASRVYNRVKQNPHLGTDLRAPLGTPILAPYTGRVAVARHLFFTGFTVILDHGYGFFTIYGHLSRLKIKEGEIARKGQALGLSGATGRASGPHLHWGVNLHGIKVDPMVLVQALK